MFQIPDDLEVGYVPLSISGAYPGLYLFTSPSRFVRPVKNLSVSSEENQNIELIGPFEQVIRQFRLIKEIFLALMLDLYRTCFPDVSKLKKLTCCFS